jgi:predicted amidohydrolase YtcJ
MRPCLTALLGALTLSLAARPAVSAPADTVYLHGAVITVDEVRPEAQAVAVTGGKITAVGSDAQISKLRGPRTRVVDLTGKTMVPGFVDGHSHIGDLMGLWTLADLSPPPVGTTDSIAGVQQTMRAYIQRHAPPTDELVVGMGYDDSLLAEKRHPNLAELDAIAPGRPICVVHVSGHLAYCNSAGLAKLGLRKDSPDPPGGRLGRDTAGDLTGALQEQAVFAVLGALPKMPLDQATRNFDEIQTYYASLGYTTAQDGQTASPVTFDVLLAAQKAGTLKIDIAAYPRWTIVDDMVAKRGITIGGGYVNRLKFAGVKITEDGSPQGKTAYLTEPYLHPPADQAADYRGYPILSAADLDQWYDRFMGRGWQVQTHCNGDACIDLVLAAIRKAYAAHPGAEKTRPVIVHSQVMRPDQLEAYRGLGVFPTFFAEHTFYWGDWHRDETLGPRRAAFISPTGSALRAGVKFSLHTDAPVVPPAAMHVWCSAVNRVTRSGAVLGPDQRLTPMQALRAITLWPAWQHFDEQIKGSITVGKAADFVILGANPLAVDPMTIKDVPVLTTIKADQVIFQRGVTPVARVPFARP